MKWTGKFNAMCGPRLGAGPENRTSGAADDEMEWDPGTRPVLSA